MPSEMRPRPKIAHEMRSLTSMGLPDSSVPQSTIEAGFLPRSAFFRRARPPAIIKKDERFMVVGLLA